MYVTRINIALKADERNALLKLSEQEWRTLQAQGTIATRRASQERGKQ